MTNRKRLPKTISISEEAHSVLSTVENASAFIEELVLQAGTTKKYTDKEALLLEREQLVEEEKALLMKREILTKKIAHVNRRLNEQGEREVYEQKLQEYKKLKEAYDLEADNLFAQYQANDIGVDEYHQKLDNLRATKPVKPLMLDKELKGGTIL